MQPGTSGTTGKWLDWWKILVPLQHNPSWWTSRCDTWLDFNAGRHLFNWIGLLYVWWPTKATVIQYILSLYIYNIRHLITYSLRFSSIPYIQIIWDYLIPDIPSHSDPPPTPCLQGCRVHLYVSPFQQSSDSSYCMLVLHNIKNMEKHAIWLKRHDFHHFSSARFFMHLMMACLGTTKHHQQKKAL